MTSANMRQTYSVDMRFHGNTGTDGKVLSLFQDGPETGGYGTKDGQGGVFNFRRNNGRVTAYALYANNTKDTWVDLGPVPAGTWHTYKIVAVWSHDPTVGRIEVYLDGHRKMLVTGRDVNLGPTSNRIPALKLGFYGDDATGTHGRG